MITQSSKLSHMNELPPYILPPGTSVRLNPEDPKVYRILLDTVGGNVEEATLLYAKMIDQVYSIEYARAFSNHRNSLYVILHEEENMRRAYVFPGECLLILERGEHI